MVSSQENMQKFEHKFIGTFKNSLAIVQEKPFVHYAGDVKLMEQKSVPLFILCQVLLESLRDELTQFWLDAYTGQNSLAKNEI